MNPKLEETIKNLGLLFARLLLGYLFFTQLWWKVPPTFGCNAQFGFTEEVNGKVQRTQGLCDWIGFESVYAKKPRKFFEANLDNTGPAEIALDVTPITNANGAFIDSFVKPNIRWFGYAVFIMEAFIAVSLMLGLLSRAGGLVGIAMAMQLQLGLSGTPGEWEWIYHQTVALAVVLAAIPSGRWLGVDQFLRPMFTAAAEKGNVLGKVFSWLT